MQAQKSSKPSKKQGCFGIIVSGGPAPGINGVISASVIEANNRGYKVKGLLNGFRGITQGEEESVIDLSIADVSTIYNTGGLYFRHFAFQPSH
jgi:ATP-dependent phosphofructokinase / diphosphate-dependent phosphofructokinase